MPDRVHAKVKTMESTGGKAVLNGSLAKAHLKQLSAGDDAVLATGELRKRPVARSQAPIKIASLSHSPYMGV